MKREGGVGWGEGGGEGERGRGGLKGGVKWGMLRGAGERRALRGSGAPQPPPVACSAAACAARDVAPPPAPPSPVHLALPRQALTTTKHVKLFEPETMSHCPQPARVVLAPPLMPSGVQAQGPPPTACTSAAGPSAAGAPGAAAEARGSAEGAGAGAVGAGTGAGAGAAGGGGAAAALSATPGAGAGAAPGLGARKGLPAWASRRAEASCRLVASSRTAPRSGAALPMVPSAQQTSDRARNAAAGGRWEPWMRRRCADVAHVKVPAPPGRPGLQPGPVISAPHAWLRSFCSMHAAAE